ncbi:hypothetical protein, partial [Streptomyces albireticuli]|uniref:hypothetical protein n=1 Tax=Streptomyces albireticuli TaxID=1940 RepID=UPI003555D8E6
APSPRSTATSLTEPPRAQPRERHYPGPPRRHDHTTHTTTHTNTNTNTNVPHHQQLRNNP